MVVGTIIGASIFVQPSEVTGQVPSVAGALLVWLTSGLLTLCGALVCAELASIFAQTGGVYVYLREAFGAPGRPWNVRSTTSAPSSTISTRRPTFIIGAGPSICGAIRGRPTPRMCRSPKVESWTASA